MELYWIQRRLQISRQKTAAIEYVSVALADARATDTWPNRRGSISLYGRVKENALDSEPLRFFTWRITVLPCAMSLPAFFAVNEVVGVSSLFDTFLTLSPSLAGVA